MDAADAAALAAAEAAGATVAEAEVDAGAAADAAAADAAAADAAGAEAGAGAEATGAGALLAALAGALLTGRESITPPPVLPPLWRLVAIYDNARVQAKNTAAATPVDLETKLEEPVAPNKLPDAPEPNAAPISAPLPCCNNTRPIINIADKT